MQVPEELSDPRRVVAAEQEDSSWRSILAGMCKLGRRSVPSQYKAFWS